MKKEIILKFQVQNLKKIVLDYSNQIIPNIKNTLRYKKYMRRSGWYLLLIYIILSFIGYSFDPLLYISLISILLLTPYSFFYNRKEQKILN